MPALLQRYSEPGRRRLRPVKGFTGQMQYGASYTLVSTASAHNVFQYWSGLSGISTSGSTNAAKFTFTVTNTVAVTASFAANPIENEAGTYYGLFYQTNNPTHQTSGLVRATSPPICFIAAKSCLMAKPLALRVNWTSSGGRPGLGYSRRSATLAFAVTNQQLIGTVSTAEWASPLTADLNTFSQNNPNVSFVGTYDIVIPPDGNGTACGFGFGSVTVGSSGAIILQAAPRMERHYPKRTCLGMATGRCLCRFTD